MFVLPAGGSPPYPELAPTIDTSTELPSRPASLEARTQALTNDLEASVAALTSCTPRTRTITSRIFASSLALAHVIGPMCLGKTNHILRWTPTTSWSHGPWRKDCSPIRACPSCSMATRSFQSFLVLRVQLGLEVRGCSSRCHLIVPTGLERR